MEERAVQSGRGVLVSRRVLLASVAFILAPSGSKAQATIDGALTQLRSSLPAVFAPEARFSADELFVQELADQELGARQQFFGRIEEFSAEDLQAAIPEELAIALRLETLEDIQAVIASGLDVVSIKQGVGRRLEPIPGEGLLAVALTLVGETMGLGFLEETLLRLLQTDGEFRSRVQASADALAIQDVRGAAEAAIEIILYLLQSAQLATMASALPGETARSIKSKILSSLGLRLVPFVGWTFTIGVFTACVYTYRHRIVAAIAR